MNILLSSSLSSEVGLGHFSRMRALNNALQVIKECTVFFSIFGDIEQDVNKKNIDFSVISDVSDEFFRLLVDFIRENSIDALVLDFHESVDDYNLFKFLKVLRGNGVKLIAIDSLVKYQQYLDYIWIPSIYFDKSKVINKDGFCEVSFGWDHFLLDRNEKVNNWNSGNEVLILTGGADLLGLSSWFPAILDKKLPKLSVINWVKGPFSKHPNLPIKSNLIWKIHDSPKDMHKLICSNDYVWTLFGVSFFEALQYGLPTVVMPYDPNKNKAELGIIENKSIAIVASNPNDSVDALSFLMQNDNLAKELSKNAKSKMLDNGCNLLANKIYKLVRS